MLTLDLCVDKQQTDADAMEDNSIVGDFGNFTVDTSDLDFLSSSFDYQFEEQSDFDSFLSAFTLDLPTVTENNDLANTNTSNNQPRFLPMTEKDKENTIKENQNKNTIRKTETCHRQFQRWLSSQNATRDASEIGPTELDNYIGLFLLSIRKSDGDEYEPDTLTSYHRGIDRYLREKQYQYSILKDREFQASREVLSSKRKELRGKGKGTKPNAALPLSVSEETALKNSGCVGLNSPTQLQNKVWLNNTMLFGMRGGKENHRLRWGDITMNVDENGLEYLEFNERATKTRTGVSSDTRKFRPKQYAHSNPDCPVRAYKEFKSHRPASMCEPDSPFYLAINYQRKPGSQTWYKNAALGENSLRNIMKKMAEKANLPGRKTNHSARKTTCTKLLHAGVAPTTIQQLTGHKNLQSINNYASASTDMQRHMSDILSNNADPVASSSPQVQSVPQAAQRGCPTHSYPSAASMSRIFHSDSRVQTSSACSIDLQSTGPTHVLQNARLMNCQITVNHYHGYGNHSPDQTQCQRKCIRIRPLDSDSD